MRGENDANEYATLPPGSIRPTRPRGGVEQYIVTRDALAALVLSMRAGDPDGLWREVCRQMGQLEQVDPQRAGRICKAR